MKRVLISVSDKTGIAEFAKEISSLGFEIISTGGTRKYLADSGIKTKSISEITGFPEIMDGRVKTLHPNVHGALLCVRDNEKHCKELSENSIELIDIVVCNLYPFSEKVNSGCSFSEAIENIDIGGPSMIRSSAKNHKYITILVDSKDYKNVISEIKECGQTSIETRKKLAAKAFRHTASYDAKIANYFTSIESNENKELEFPESITMTFNKKQDLRYGENAHQGAAFYESENNTCSVAFSKQLNGKELSYNNIRDADSAINLICEFSEPACVGLKHMNPCGVGTGSSILEAWNKAYNADSVSIYGGIIIVNRNVDIEFVKAIKPVFLEILMAPSFDADALELLKTKKNLRVLEVKLDKPKTEKSFVSVNGGMVIQDKDNFLYNSEDIKCVTKKVPSALEYMNLIFAMKVCKHVKSNAIVVASDFATCGIGAGQMNRVGACDIALRQAKENNKMNGLVLASDAFFPFDDVVKLAKDYGVTSIIQPGGSIRDEDSIIACDELGISMIFTSMRHFWH